MLTRWNNSLWSDGWPDAGAEHRSWDALFDLRREMDQLFGELAPSAARRRQAPGPRMEMADEGGALTLRIELPGFTEEDIQVDLNRSTLTVRGQRGTAVPDGYSVHRQERGAMSFARTMTLPCRVLADEVRATLKDGVLELSLPKAPEEQPRTIEVRALD